MSRTKKIIGIIVIAYFVLLIGFFSYYSYWNSAPPDRTCKSCHEIENSYNMWTVSSHQDVKCIECHGTALSNGLHSLREKMRMVFRHYSRDFYDEISLNEEQVIAMNQTCKKCHHAEFAAWSSGGHSVNYPHIFLDEEQNSKEELNHDCLRCHGMFYAGDIYSLVDPISIEGPWHLKDPAKSNHPVIPCLTCHKVHEPGITKASFEYTISDSVHYTRPEPYSSAGLYVYHERMFLKASELPKPVMWDGTREVRVSDDPLMRLCIQCHAPKAWQHAGSADDRTPLGVHEGISCLSCHDKHSNSAVRSCVSCHPAISNCGLDVMAMNTSYADRQSPHNIHFVSCDDCHEGERPAKILR